MSRAFLASWALVLPALAQTLPADQEAQFRDRGRWIGIQDGARAQVRLEVPGRKAAESWTAPAGLFSLDHVEGRFYGTQFQKTAEGRREVRLLSSAEGRDWRVEGVLPLKGAAGIWALHPLGGEWVVGVAKDLFWVEGKASPLALFRRRGADQLAFERLLDLDLPKGYLEGLKGQPGGEGFGFAETSAPFFKVFFTLGKELEVRFDGGLAFASAEAGTIWVVTGGDAPSVRSGSLYAGVEAAWCLAAKGDLEKGILGCQPQADGRLLVAARTEEALKAYAAAGFEDDGRPDPVRDAQRARRERELLARHPEVRWWTFDPVTCTFSPAALPPRAPSRLMTPEEVGAFRFRHRLDGSLEVSYN